MSKSILLLAVAIALGLAASQALAVDGFREVGPYGYGYGNPAVVNNFYLGGYGNRWNQNYGNYGNYGGGYRNDPYAEAVRRIQASHSRSRYFTHPQSLYNAPPRPDYDPRWPYGY